MFCLTCFSGGIFNSDIYKIMFHLSVFEVELELKLSLYTPHLYTLNSAVIFLMNYYKFARFLVQVFYISCYCV